MMSPPALPGDFVLVLREGANWTFRRFPVILPETYRGTSLATKSQRKATRAHRRRAAARGLVRVEVQAAKKDAGLIRALAETLRDKPERADALRSTLANALLNPEIKTAFDVFGSELPDEAFSGVFDQPRRDGWREVDL
jgi:hypothetical protein